MNAIQEMLKAHPHPAVMGRGVDMGLLSQTASELFDCAQACTACADACVGEDQVQNLKRCIRMCMDCADICEATGRLVSRETESDMRMMRSQLQACATACGICAEECERHASRHEHCRICGESCRRCEQACNKLAGAITM
ncbi:MULTISPECIES: four-helix bundle copper-binding protein [Methylocaldum]|jgi:hypothetical protein|uniref:four-helix bundle copper-binding protein n=1 Tax=unclassified Methylocaldum TaxID=2622260 RepID=UPI00098ACCFA|nr:MULTISPECIES: four-helix bundle copper-binding protein [unclassified Methylocaldum]MBP1152414.1 hypothetical protein [Methylocaldum sp. RMAD-M]MDV3242020.1 four-helix bundle copper-binding protein [Methylocaldum sp.]MVF21592.1 four-helix bundle copper-binding protein [Methylocaldum sp. BRCS4]